MEHYVLQNNACNIYQQYFDDTEPSELVKRIFCRTVNVYRDPLPTKRPVSHISWSPDQGSRIAVSYCCTDFKKLVNLSPISYIWDVGAFPYTRPFLRVS
jgi:dynein intermediate chain 2